MPYRDAEDRRTYDRERKRRLRAVKATGGPVLPSPARLRQVEDVEALLAQAVQLVRADARARGVEKARALGYLASIALRLVEAHDLQERLEALEGVLQARTTA